MGGKSKQSQRTKNNARPSSSGRSAELLINATNINPNVLNVPGGNVLPTLFLNIATIDKGLNNEFSLCIKKLNKKDPVTKTKALQELNELLTNREVDDVVAVLPSWALLYKTLTLDTDHKVRESAQVCQGAIMHVCGRRAAPQLKQLVPAWLQAQYDEYAPAAAAAQAALQNTFPNNKLIEVISFCKTEVISHLHENLVGNTENYFIRRTDDKDERDVQFSRIVASSLKGLEYFTKHLPSKHDEWLWGELTLLLQNNNFWKLSSHQSQQVRASWYAAVGRIIERFKETFGEQFGQKTTRIILCAGKERSALVAAQLWTCLLLLMYNVKNWHVWVDKKDLLAKRILDILENGGWGDARLLTNLLLPLLAHLPDDMINKEFYDSFFNAIFTGLQKKNVMSSKSERQSWITSLSECLRYLAEKEHGYIVEVTTSVHRTWLEIILSSDNDTQTRNNLLKHSAANMASLVKYWLKQSKEGNGERYDQLVRNFWQNIASTLVNQIQKLSAIQEEVSNLVDGHILLLQALKTSFSNDEKKQQRIKFEDEPSQEEEKKVVANKCDESITNRYKHNLNEATGKVCCEYFEFANTKRMSDTVLSPIITLFTQFNSENLFSALVKHFGTNSMYGFYDKVLRKFLCDDKMQSEAVVSITFLMMEYLTEEEQDLIYESFKQLSFVVLEWCLYRATSHPHRERAACRRFVRGPDVARVLSTVCAHMLHTADCADRNLLLQCVHGDMLISEDTLCEIVEQFRSALSVECNTVEHSARVAAQLVGALAAAAAPAHAALAPLVSAMVELTMLLQRDDGRLPVETWREVLSAWHDGLAALSRDERRVIVAQAARRMRQLVMQRDDVNIPEIDHLMSLCPYLLQFTEPTDPTDVIEVVMFTQTLLDFEQCHETPIEFFALRYDCIVGNLNCPFDDDNEIINMVVKKSSNKNAEELTKENFIAHEKRILLRAMYLRKILINNVTDELEQREYCKEGFGNRNEWCSALMNQQRFEQEFLQMIHDHAVVSSLHANYGFWPHYEILHKTYMKIQTVLDDISGDMSPELKRKLHTSISEIAATKGYYWSYAKRFLDFKTNGDNQDNGDELKNEVNFEVENLKNIVTGNGFFHTLQLGVASSSDIEAVLNAKYLLMLRSFYSCHSREPLVVDEQFVVDAVRCHRECNMDVIVNAYYRHNHVLLCDRDVTSASWLAVISNAAILNFLTTWVEARGWDAPSHHWDFTTITLCSLMTTINKSKKAWGTTKVALLSRASMYLYSSVQRFITRVPSECERRMPSSHVAHLPAEWKDIFAPDLLKNLFAIHMYLLDVSVNELTSNRVAFIGGVLEASRAMSGMNLSEVLKKGEYSVENVIGRACNALRAPATHAQLYLAHQALLLVANALVAEDSKRLQEYSDQEENESESRSTQPSFSLMYCNDALTHLQELVDAALTNFNAGEGTCELVPFSGSHAVALAYLLLTDALLAAAHRAAAAGELYMHYMQLVKNHRYTEYLITCTLRLLPASIAAYALERTNTFPADCLDMFQTDKQFKVEEAPSALDVGALSCRCLYRSLGGVGASCARAWRADASPAAARVLTRLVRAAVAPGLVRSLLRELQEHEAELEDTEISIVSNEVRCVYGKNSDRFELHVAYAKDHPLTAPRVAELYPDERPDLSAPHQLYFQGGRLLDGARLWVRARASSGCAHAASSCCVCYCRVHPATGQLPLVVCMQCNNNYHNTCLRKWFTVNTKCQCPVCRCPF